MEAVLAQLDEALDAAAAFESADAGEWVVALQARRSRMEAITTHAARRFDVEGELEGARSAVAWLAHRCRVPKWQAKRWVSNGRALHDMPGVAGALDRGAVGAEA